MTPTRRVALPWVLGSLCCSLALSAQLAHAQATSADSKAAAEALFDEGLSLMQKGDLAAACLKLEQSQSIDHGIGTMLYLAECYEKSGRTASAWALFRQASSEAAAAGESERAEAGRRRAERLTPLLSKLTITVATPTLAGLQVTRNGAPVPSVLWGVATPVDPGEHRVEARAPGYAPWSASVSVGAAAGNTAAEAASLSVPALAPDASAVAATPPSEPPAVTASDAAAAAPQTTRVDDGAKADTTGSMQRTVGFVLGSAGIVAVGVGAVFGLQAISKHDDAKPHCPGDTTCLDQKGITLNNDALSAARLANVFVIGGAVLAAAGIVVYLVAPAHEQPTLAFASDGRSVSATLGGAF